MGGVFLVLISDKTRANTLWFVKLRLRKQIFSEMEGSSEYQHSRTISSNFDTVTGWCSSHVGNRMFMSCLYKKYDREIIREACTTSAMLVILLTMKYHSVFYLQ